MEQFLPLIIGLAFFVYKTYSNYKTEQEKARKRNLSQPLPKNKNTEAFPSKSLDKPQPFLDYERNDDRENYEPQYKNTYKEPVVHPPVKEESYQRMQSEVYSEAEPNYREKPVEGTLKNRKIQQAHKHSNTKVNNEEELTVYEFDMKDAIIKEAILNRPKF